MRGTVYTVSGLAMKGTLVYLSPHTSRGHSAFRFVHYLPPTPISPPEAPVRPSNGWEWVREGMARANRLDAVDARDLKDLAAALAGAIRIIERMEARK